MQHISIFHTRYFIGGTVVVSSSRDALRKAANLSETGASDKEGMHLLNYGVVN